MLCTVSNTMLCIVSNTMLCIVSNTMLCTVSNTMLCTVSNTSIALSLTGGSFVSRWRSSILCVFSLTYHERVNSLAQPFFFAREAAIKEFMQIRIIRQKSGHKAVRGAIIYAPTRGDWLGAARISPRPAELGTHQMALRSGERSDVT